MTFIGRLILAATVLDLNYKWDIFICVDVYCIHYKPYVRQRGKCFFQYENFGSSCESAVLSRDVNPNKWCLYVTSSIAELHC